MFDLYILDGSIVIGHASLASEASHNKFEYWHLRLRHVSERSLVELAKQGFPGKEKLDKLEFYDHCILDKQHE
jgi:hypothetical protein